MHTGTLKPALAHRLAAQRTGRGRLPIEHDALADELIAKLTDGAVDERNAARALRLVAEDKKRGTEVATSLVSSWVAEMAGFTVVGVCNHWARLLQVHAFRPWYSTEQEIVRAVEQHAVELVREHASTSDNPATVRQVVMQGMFRPFADRVAAINFTDLTIERWHNIIAGEGLSLLNELGLVSWLTPALFADAIMQIDFWGTQYTELQRFLTGKPGAYLIAASPEPEETLARLRELQEQHKETQGPWTRTAVATLVGNTAGMLEGNG